MLLFCVVLLLLSVLTLPLVPFDATRPQHAINYKTSHRTYSFSCCCFVFCPPLFLDFVFQYLLVSYNHFHQVFVDDDGCDDGVDNDGCDDDSDDGVDDDSDDDNVDVIFV